MGQAAKILAISDAAGRRARRRLAVRSLVNDESGATAIEYGLIVALIAVVVLAAVTVLGGSSGDSWSASWTKISDAI